MTVIQYAVSDDPTWEYVDRVHQLAHEPDIRSVCDVGAGRRPTIGLDDIHATGVDYTMLDISAEELAHAPCQLRKVQADICDPHLPDIGQFDLVFSRELAEHVRSGEQFHRNVRSILHTGGLAAHFFPTLWTVPFAVNKFVPDRTANRLLSIVRPERPFRFPAHYDWCRGPTHRQIRRLESVGFEIVEYWAFFGHLYYERFGPLHRLEMAFADHLAHHPVPALTSYTFVVLRAR